MRSTRTCGTSEGGAAVTEPILSVRDLRVEFRSEGRRLPAVDGVSFDLWPGRTLGLVGESGSGKSVTSLALLRLVPDPPGRITGGSIRFAGEDLLAQDPAAMRRIRGRRIAMIFQDPMTSLNPYLRVGRQLGEVLELHERATRREARRRAIEMLERVGLPDAANRVDRYPHEFSGGMRQRVMIAMALLCKPAVLIADEPTTALDVTVQAQILDLVRELRDEMGTAVLLITHDLGVVAGIADEIAVMYAGRIVERGPTAELFARPRHPYTLGLLRCIPRLDADPGRLTAIPGRPPELDRRGAGCDFAPRCGFVLERCRSDRPALRAAGTEHGTACHVDVEATSG
jgi:oligopeptide transport system ATP-binding protein